MGSKAKPSVEAGKNLCKFCMEEKIQANQPRPLCKWCIAIDDATPDEKKARKK